eukprot:scaffold353713_cov22-Prasinocladus_malaysianus.AAC.2
MLAAAWLAGPGQCILYSCSEEQSVSAEAGLARRLDWSLQVATVLVLVVATRSRYRRYRTVAADLKQASARLSASLRVLVRIR